MSLHHSKAQLNKKNAFTLIEILIVVVIIWIVAGTLVTRIIGAQSRVRDTARTLKVNQIATAVEIYAEDHGWAFPVSNFYTQTNNISSSISDISDKIWDYLTEIPSEPWKGIIAMNNGSCRLTGESFGYFTDSVGSMYAITHLMESRRGNTNNCLGVVDSENTAKYNVRGRSLIYTVYPPAEHRTAASCFCLGWDCSNFSWGITTFSSKCPKDIVIPRTINGVTVTSITWFYSKSITSVVIPNSIQSIWEYVFSTNLLRYVYIPDSVTRIEKFAFRNNNLKTIYIPDSVVHIGWRAFAGNLLTKIVLPSSVGSLWENVFTGNGLNKDSNTMDQKNTFVENTNQTRNLVWKDWIKQ